MRSEKEIQEKFLEEMQNVYGEIKVELLAIKTGDWSNAYWDKERRDEFIDTLCVMLDEVPQDCGSCMGEKLYLINDYGITVSQMDNIYPANDGFAEAWNRVIWEVTRRKSEVMRVWLDDDGSS